MFTLEETLWLFLIYAFLGWCTEVAFAAVTRGKFVNRGMANGPICPIYGFGVLAVLFCLQPFRGNFFLLFLGSVVVTSLLELVTGWALEKFSTTSGGIIPMNPLTSRAISACGSPSSGGWPACWW